jgi:2-hydroxychromene-2-carboxylate isomerase
VRDAQLLAEYWNVEFPGKKTADPGIVRDVAAAMIRERPAAESLAAALELGTSMWNNDRKAVVTGLGKWGVESHGSVPPALNTNYAELRKAGHYQGAMIAYGGEWYWGLDRVHYLEAALARDLGTEVKHVVAPRPEAERGPKPILEKIEGKPEQPLACEFWFSFRSPYSYLGVEQISSILAPYGVPLRLRPVLPIATRNTPFPTVKQLYIVRDAKREADRLGIPFGDLCDPLGAAIDHCLAIAQWADTQGPDAALAFARSALRGIWSEAKDLTEYVDLRTVVERAGLSWDGARAALADVAPAQKWAAQAAADMAVLSLWGVPSFRVGEVIAWGQDRLPLLADRLRRHAAHVSAH